MTITDQPPTTDPDVLEANRTARLRSAHTHALRTLADWIDQHPELGLPYGVDIGKPNPVSISVLDDTETTPERFAAAVKALGGARVKEADDGYMCVRRVFGPGVEVEIWTTRSRVCEAVVVGTEQVQVEEIVTPAVTRNVTEERDIVEWRCAPILTAPLGIAAARASLGGQS